MEKYRVVLIPKKEFLKDFYKVTKHCAQYAQGYLMSANTSLPHITLLSGFVDYKDLEVVWSNINHFKSVPVFFDNLNFIMDGVGSFVRMDIKDNDIIEIRNRVMDVARVFFDHFTDRSEKEYTPYMSLLYTKLPLLQLNDLLDKSVFERGSSIPFNIAIAKSGENGMIKEIVFK